MSSITTLSVMHRINGSTNTSTGIAATVGWAVWKWYCIHAGRGEFSSTTSSTDGRCGRGVLVLCPLMPIGSTQELLELFV